MRLALFAALAKLLRIRFKVDGLCYGSAVSPPRIFEAITRN